MNHWRKWLIAVLGGIALAAALALVAPGDLTGQEALALVQGTIYVDVDATGANDGSSWENAYTALQPALDEATAGDQIWVAAGTYKPTYEFDPGEPRTATFQLKNGVAVYGGFDPSAGDTDWDDRDWTANATILSGDVGSWGNPADNSYHVFYHPAGLALDATAVLDGFVITAGYAHASGHLRGGGMYNEGSSPTVLHCTFVGNSAATGGGMANYDASSPTVADCTFSENEAGIGGGMANYNASSPTVTHSSFLDNDCSSGAGGGMLNDHSSPTVSSCTFAGNTAVSGGGMYNNTGSSPVVTNCIFAGNSVTANGAGLKNYTATAPVVTNCTFWGNSADDYGGGIYNVASNLTATNCILWGDTPDEIAYDGAAPVVSYSDIQGGYAGTANIDEDPQFEDPANGDVDLLADSPCVDAGSNGAPSLPATDFEGDPRIWDGDFDGTATADMGADEFASHTFALQMAGNGSGSVEQTPEGARLEHGTLVTLTAIADIGSAFTDWSGDVVGTANPITLTMDMDKVVTATFEAEIHTLAVSYAGNGSGLVSLDPPGGSYDYGTNVTLTAVANPGSTFMGWSGDAGGTANPVTLTMDADKAVTATFVTYWIYVPLVAKLGP